jgi:hypothetical protein
MLIRDHRKQKSSGAMPAGNAAYQTSQKKNRAPLTTISTILAQPKPCFTGPMRHVRT